jgi:hypothetical protein
VSAPAASAPATGRVDLALRLGALALLLHPVGTPAVRAAMLALAGAALLFPACLRSAATWAALAALAALRVALDWPLADNHAYLLAYWCLAAALALASREPDAWLAWNGRRLLGLVFLFATGWKLVSPDFLDGTFLAVTSLRDPRFEGVTRLLAGFGPQELAAAREALEQHTDGAPPETVAGVAAPFVLRSAARLAALYTVALEAAIALFFLWPARRRPAGLRDAALLLFCASTYAVATVAGFAWLLLAMGVAQCEPERRRTRAAYLAAFALVLFYATVPWAGRLAARLGAGG